MFSRLLILTISSLGIIPLLAESSLAQIPEQLPVSQPENSPQKITVTQFNFEGNTVFTKEQLNELLRDFTQKEVSFPELLEAEKMIRDLYINSGYINSDAVITANQNLSLQGGIVTIKIVEGGIEDIIIKGNKRLNSHYILSRIKLGIKSPFNRNELLESLQLLQLNPLIETISANLSTGVRPELSVLEITVKEADSFDLNLMTDNGRNPAVGSWERGISISEGNLFGIGDAIDLTYTNTDGSNAFDGSYIIPINAKNGTIKIAGGFNDTEIIEEPFDELNITGDSTYFDLTYRQPIINTPNQELALGLTGSLQKSKTELLGEGFNLSKGANNEGETNISALRFFQDWIKRNPREIIALRSQFNLGINAFDATINDSLPDSTFFSWRTQGQYVKSLAPDTFLVVKSDLQLSADELLAQEKFGLGGLGSVRGYRQDLLLTDNAFFASMEARFPVLRIREVQGVLQVVPFLDFGVGWNTNFTTPEDNTLLSLGLGLNWQMSDNFNLRFDWGIPLIDVKQGDKTWQENGIYFSLDWKI